MDPLSIPRTIVDRSLKLARLPLDGTLRIVGRGKRGRAAGARVAVDRVDAGVREAAGAAIGDERLRADAARRRTAADERSRAHELQSTAERRKEEAGDRLARERADAQRQRRQAQDAARQREREIERDREAQSERLERSEDRRKAAVDAAVGDVQEDVDERARRSRHRQLADERDALDKQKEATTARDEARRLGQAAARTKAARKSR